MRFRPWPDSPLLLRAGNSKWRRAASNELTTRASSCAVEIFEVRRLLTGAVHVAGRITPFRMRLSGRERYPLSVA